MNTFNPIDHIKGYQDDRCTQLSLDRIPSLIIMILKVCHLHYYASVRMKKKEIQNYISFRHDNTFQYLDSCWFR